MFSSQVLLFVVIIVGVVVVVVVVAFVFVFVFVFCFIYSCGSLSSAYLMSFLLAVIISYLAVFLLFSAL